MEHLTEAAYRDALIQEDIVPLANADVEIVQAEEGKPFIFKATVQVRPEVTLGDYRNFNFGPEIEPTDDARVDKVIDELRDQNATLTAVEDRPAKEGDYAVIGFVGTRDGEPFDGGSTDRMPLILGQERLIPGFEANLIGLDVGASTDFDVTFPEDYGEPTLAGQTAHFAVDLKELREKILPDLDDDFVHQMGDFADVAALRTDIHDRLAAQRPGPRPPRRSRTGSSSTPWPTPPSSCPRSWSTRKSRSCTTSSAARSPGRASTRRPT